MAKEPEKAATCRHSSDKPGNSSYQHNTTVVPNVGLVGSSLTAARRRSLFAVFADSAACETYEATGLSYPTDLTGTCLASVGGLEDEVRA